MRELPKVGGLPGSNIEATPPWMKNAYAYKREPNVSEGFEYVTGYAEFKGLRGTEAEALKQAMTEVNPNRRVHDHHQQAYNFVHIPPEEATQVERKMRSWGYSPRNQVDLLRRSLDLPDVPAKQPRRTSRRTRQLQSEPLF